MSDLNLTEEQEVHVPKFKPGDVVCLKNKSAPSMVVGSIRKNFNDFFCVWFDVNRHVQNSYFNEDVLMLVADLKPKG